MTTTENDKYPTDAARYPLQVGAAIHVLADGRISIFAEDPTQATKIAQNFQALGNNVRQYGSRLIIHADGQ